MTCVDWHNPHAQMCSAEKEVGCSCRMGLYTDFMWLMYHLVRYVTLSPSKGRVTPEVDDQHTHSRYCSWTDRWRATVGVRHSLCGNFGGLSLTSVRVILTSVVPDSPPMWPPMSLAWMTTSYSWRASRSMFGKAVRIIPEWRECNIRLMPTLKSQLQPCTVVYSLNPSIWV